MKRTIVFLMAALFLFAAAGCQKQESAGGSSDVPPVSKFDTSKAVKVITREEGSGTRGAFIELMGIEQKDADGNKVDMTTVEADTTNSTSVMMTSVAGNPYAIGYISLGSLNDMVKAVQVDGVEATVANVKAGTYKVARPFNVAVKEEGLSDLAKDFLAFIQSAEGQKVITDAGYVSVVDDAKAYSGTKPEGKIVVAGSSSVTPVMEKLKEAYLAVNTNASIEVQQSDSSTGMSSAIAGSCDIGMASRELKDSELAKGLTPVTIAMDGIAVVVNNENPAEELSSEQIKEIFLGNVDSWKEILG